MRIAVWILLFTIYAFAETLSVDIAKLKSGIDLIAIKMGDKNLIKPSKTSLFTLKLQRLNDKKIFYINSRTGWRGFDTNMVAGKRIIKLSNPVNSSLPKSLYVTIELEVRVKKIYLDLKVKGIGKDFTLLESKFPMIMLKKINNDSFFVPYRFGKVIYDPTSRLDYGDNKPNSDFLNADAGLYPMGWGATMQYMAYWGDEYGLVFIAADPRSYIKTLIAKAENNSIKIGTSIPAPNMSRASNDFDYPGRFVISYFHGDWFDAAMIYKNWAKKSAYYYPKRLTEGSKRLKDVDLWMSQALWNGHGNYKVGVIESMTKKMKRFMGDDVVLGAYWLSPYDRENEDDFPRFYPSKTAKALTYDLKREFKDKISLSLYTNGFLYDMDISTPDRDVPPFLKVRAYAAKDQGGNIYTQKWIGNRFAIMCPTQKRWQDILANIHKKYIAPIGNDGVLLDQITASAPRLCFDPNHGHTLGGGDYWRRGYKELIKKIKSAYPRSNYIVSETFNDSLADVIDGYETIYHLTQNQVPAVQVVYGDKLSFIGPKPPTGSYQNRHIKDSQTFYSITTEAFITGSTMGYYYPDLTDGINSKSNTQRSRAAKFVRELAQIRLKLKNYIAFGQMQRPLSIYGVPRVSSEPNPKHWVPKVSMSAIRNSVYRASDGSLAIIFVNASKPDSHQKISFNFLFDPSRYGLKGTHKITQITPYKSVSLGRINGKFKKKISLEAGSVVAFVVK